MAVSDGFLLKPACGDGVAALKAPLPVLVKSNRRGARKAQPERDDHDHQSLHPDFLSTARSKRPFIHAGSMNLRQSAGRLAVGDERKQAGHLGLLRRFGLFDGKNSGCDRSDPSSPVLLSVSQGDRLLGRTASYGLEFG
jgi:hypothetical protein